MIYQIILKGIVNIGIFENISTKLEVKKWE